MNGAAALLLVLGILALLGAGLAWAIFTNIEVSGRFHQRLAEQIRALRLGRALGLFDVEHKRYLHGQRAVDIETQIDKCKACQDLNRCDQVLDGDGTREDFHFCPNHQAFENLSRGIRESDAADAASHRNWFQRLLKHS
ncbi:MAG: hypothetical protein DRQ37_03655 [Gammaproteobacteria bacterium]|nr:MAG: hypothetical protein DRQ37_03655 [Gammaproteobacteria bacterium]